jgi:hypothetical protein
MNPTAFLEIPGVYPAGFAITASIVLVCMALQGREQIRDYHAEMKRWEAAGSRWDREPDHPINPFHVIGAILGAALAAVMWPLLWGLAAVLLLICAIGFPVIALLSIGTKPEDDAA